MDEHQASEQLRAQHRERLMAIRRFVAGWIETLDCLILDSPSRQAIHQAAEEDPERGLSESVTHQPK